jgi:hypothetical protein
LQTNDRTGVIFDKARETTAYKIEVNNKILIKRRKPLVRERTEKDKESKQSQEATEGHDSRIYIACQWNVYELNSLSIQILYRSNEEGGSW